MSCDVAVAAFLMFASTSPGTTPGMAPATAVSPEVVLQQPLYRNIVRQAAALRGDVDAYRKTTAAASAPAPLPGFDAFGLKVGQLSTLDEQGHVELLAGNYTGDLGDLKCILHGISQDLKVKLTAVTAAKTGHDEDLALRDMRYLLNDNVEVIDPPKHASGVASN
jgi:hypothetical protein